MSEDTAKIDGKPHELRAKSLWEGGLKTNTLIRGFELPSDDPIAEWGTNTAPSPAENFLAAISACFITTYSWIALMSRLSLAAITVSASGKIDDVNDVHKISKIDLAVKVTSHTDNPDKLQKCYELAHKRCLLLNTLDCEKNISFEYKIEKTD
jgi:uncharacterized OsmC-like protein